MRRTWPGIAAAGVFCLASSAVDLPTSRPKISRREAMIKAAALNRETHGLFKDKRYADAAAKCTEALALPLPAEMLGNLRYNLACAQARLGKKADALASLAAAVQYGWDDVDHMQADADLESLRAEQQFKDLAAKLNVGVAPTFIRRGEVTLVEGKSPGGLHYRVHAGRSPIPIRRERSPIPLHRERPPIPLHRDWSLDWSLDWSPGPKATKADPQRLVVWLHPSGGLMNGEAEKMAGLFRRRGLALMVFTQKSAMGWSASDARKALKTVRDVGRIEGLCGDRPILMGYSAGGQVALSLWAAGPGRFGGLIIDAAYPVDMKAYAQRKARAFDPPADPAVRLVPFFVLVGTRDGGATIWRAAEKQWAQAGVPLTVLYVENAGHAWLFGRKQTEALDSWLGAPAGPSSAPATRPAP